MSWLQNPKSGILRGEAKCCTGKLNPRNKFKGLQDPNSRYRSVLPTPAIGAFEYWCWATYDKFARLLSVFWKVGRAKELMWGYCYEPTKIDWTRNEADPASKGNSCPLLSKTNVSYFFNCDFTFPLRTFWFLTICDGWACRLRVQIQPLWFDWSFTRSVLIRDGSTNATVGRGWKP